MMALRSLGITAAILLAGVLTMAFAGGALAATIRVDLNGGGDYPTIQEGIAAAATGDVVTVAPGFYIETITISKRINLVGAGADSVTIYGGDAVTFTSGGSDAKIKGFTIQSTGTGITCSSSSPIIMESVITDNSIGISCSGSSPTIANNVITGNGTGISCSQGSYPYPGSSPMIVNNRITSNSNRGIYCSGSDPTIANNVISGNGNGLYCDDDSSPTVTNNVIADNTGDGVYCYSGSSPEIVNNVIVNSGKNGVYCGYDSSPVITNNVIVNNAEYGIDRYSGSPTIAFNDVWRNSGGNYNNVSAGPGDISKDPQFVEGLPYDYHLKSGAPCVDAGRSGDQYLDPDGTRNDIGAYGGPGVAGWDRMIKAVSISDTSAAVGATFSVPVVVDSAEGIAGIEIILTYDSKVLTATDAQATSLTSGFSISVSTASGKIAISMASSEGIADGDGSIVDVTFTVTSSAPDTARSLLGLKTVSLYDERTNPIIVWTQDGTFTVGPPTVPEGIRGDINDDGIIDVRDAIICLRIAAGLPMPSGVASPTAQQRWAADADSNGTVQSADALQILALAANRLLAKRAFTGGRVPSSKAVVILPDRLEGERLSLRVENGVNPGALDVVLRYNASRLEIVDVQAGREGALMVFNREMPGRLRVAMASLDGIAGEDGALLRVQVKAKGKVESDPLQVEQIHLFDREAFPMDVRALSRRHLVSQSTPLGYRLVQNYPNPFNPGTFIEVYFPAESTVRVDIYNLQGQLVRTLMDGLEEVGVHRLYWDGRDRVGRLMSSGVYVCRMEAEEITQSIKMIAMH